MPDWRITTRMNNGHEIHSTISAPSFPESDVQDRILGGDRDREPVDGASVGAELGYVVYPVHQVECVFVSEIVPDPTLEETPE